MQIGVQRGIVVEGLSPADLRVVMMLDGTRPLHSVRRSARRVGCSRARLDELLGVLRAEGALIDAPEPHVAVRRIVVDDGRTHPGGDPSLLGEVLHGVFSERGTDVLSGDGAAWVADFAMREAEHPPDLVTLVRGGVVEPGVGDPWLRRGVPHLPLVVRDGHVVVGPLVESVGPCLTCLDLHRTHRDPAWPRVLAELQRVTLQRWGQVDRGTAYVAAGTAMRLVDLWTRGRLPVGLSVEITTGAPSMTTRRWEAHPDCRAGHVDSFGTLG